MSTEESPLLPADQPDDGQRARAHEEIYDRFSTAQKRTIVSIVSFAGLVPFFVSGSFVPSIPQVAKDLDATPAVVSLAVSLSVFAAAIGALVWSAYSAYYGRRPMYLWGMPFMSIGSFAVASSSNLSSLLFWRFVQTFGGAGGMSLGAAVIGDIYKLEERGTAMGSFFGATLVGLAIAPLCGGVAAEYWSWRGLHLALGVWGLLQMLLIHIFLPETAHPNTRGVDKLVRSRKMVVWVNPFSSLGLLRSPNLMAVTLANGFVLVSDFVLLIPLAYTIGVRYNITSDALIGACFLPNGLGNLIGAPISGYLSDMVVRRWKDKRNGVWIPEDRLRATYVGGLILVPLSVVAAGLTTTYIDGPVGLAINLVCLFTNGLGVDLVMVPIGAYNVDIMHSRSAEVMAATMAFRSLFLAPISGLIIPSIETIGVAATNGAAALLALVGYFLIWLTIRYGHRMRAYVDVGYSSAANN
ncbi:Drug:H+ antiporter-1 family protein [Paxillus involutus ATCC 200175]|uniref:Drug:H+ antiporter-1 family protein n=1 Tax=Paxillus involutus ATCC 200175 TaxID=664439 RepID=A0A0C9TZ39_PAXIN|nr:Drug:H+ antiporter-1 family protein [Paxillus involutus ATCC 200175]